MKKQQASTIFVCKECGYESLKWLGRCPECGSWNSLAEFTKTKDKETFTTFASEVSRLTDLRTESKIFYITTEIKEFDRILGGGIVPGAVILIGGEPGVGKSTLMLQIADKISSTKKFDQEYYKVLYVTGEESLEQISLRAKRLQIENPNIYILSETLFENVVEAIEKTSPDVVIIDSIQTMYSEYIPNTQGSIPQIRGITAEVIKLAKSRGITFFILGHVTKEGDIAGPKLLEHMVDTVLYFETETAQNYRILRVYKNRFGASSEIGIFEMTSLGLKEIENPSEFFVYHVENSVGTVTTCLLEGTRPLLTQIQALTTKSYFPQPRRVVSGLDYNRVMLLISVLEKFVGINLVYEDIYLNVVAGLKTKETVVDLPIVLAIYSSHKNVAVDTKTVYLGEIGLAGELRPVSFINERIAEITKLGYKKLVLPLNNKKNVNSDKTKDLQLVYIHSITEIDKIL